MPSFRIGRPTTSPGVVDSFTDVIDGGRFAPWRAESKTLANVCLALAKADAGIQRRTDDQILLARGCLLTPRSSPGEFGIGLARAIKQPPQLIPRLGLLALSEGAAEMPASIFEPASPDRMSSAQQQRRQ